MSKSRLLNYFKHVPDDLVVTSTTGTIVSVVGCAVSPVRARASMAAGVLKSDSQPMPRRTFILIVLFLFELHAYLSVTTVTDLVVDELVDETLRVNFNVTLHAVSAPQLGAPAPPWLRPA
jgi:Na+/alanine symporter